MCAATSGFYTGAGDQALTPPWQALYPLAISPAAISAFYVKSFFLLSQYAARAIWLVHFSLQPPTPFTLQKSHVLTKPFPLPPGEGSAAGHTSLICPHLLLGRESETTGLAC